MDIKYGRKRSGIKKELKLKIDQWLESIKDPGVKKLAEENAIVTGGSIASMLLGEKVNDYDVYFKTKEAVIAVATYYVGQYNEKHKTDFEVKEETLKNIKGEEEDRVVVWIQSVGVAGDEDAKPDDEKSDYRVSFMSQNAITLTDKIQIVIRFYGEPSEIHDNYDFVHAMCYYDHAENDLVTSIEALEAMMSRTLYYKGSLYPIASIFRTKKFLERGWRIGAGQQLKIMWQISEIDLTDPVVMREQLTGVDMAYLHQLISALEGVDKKKINSTYVGAIIDKIFDGEQ